MFIPAPFRVEDRETLYAFMETYSFATLIGISEQTPFASHVPLLLDRQNHQLSGHVARGNSHWTAFETQETLAIFHGPHAYISPSWYAALPAVPTWNYAVVHAYGKVRIASEARTEAIVDETVRKYESPRDDPWRNELPPEYRRKMLAGIVGFEMSIERIEGKFKLGQNRSLEDQTGMLNGLRNVGPEAQTLARFIESQKK